MPVPFGINGSRLDIDSTQVSGSNNASYPSGFPDITMLDESAGGVPPKGQNFNQILYELANGLRWNNAGRLYNYDASWSSSNSGYPKGALVLGSDNQTIYMSSVDDNTTDPNSSSSSGWINKSTQYLKSSDYLSEFGQSITAGAGSNSGLTSVTASATITPASNGIIMLVNSVYGGNGISEISISVSGSGSSVVSQESQFITVGTGSGIVKVTKGVSTTVSVTGKTTTTSGLKVSFTGIFIPTL